MKDKRTHKIWYGKPYLAEDGTLKTRPLVRTEPKDRMSKKVRRKRRKENKEEIKSEIGNRMDIPAIVEERKE